MTQQQKLQIPSTFYPQQNAFPISSSREERKQAVFQLIPGPQVNRKKEDDLLMEPNSESVKKSDIQPMILQSPILNSEKLNTFAYSHQIFPQCNPIGENNSLAKLERIKRGGQ